MAFRLLLGALFFCIAPVQASVYTSTVLDAATRKPIAYSNVGIPGKGMGTVTDEQGRFSLDIPEDADTLVVSIIGYAEARIACGRVMPAEILLSKRAGRLKEVIVKAGNRKHQTLGNRTKNRSNSVGFGNCTVGQSIGTLMHIGWSPCFIERLQFNVRACSYDTLFIRVNIYEDVDGAFVGALNEPIYLTLVNPGRNMKEIKVDLSQRNISVSHDFLVSLELVKNLGPGKLTFCAKKRGSPTFIKVNSGRPWTHMAGAFEVDAIGFSAYVTN